MKKTFNSALKNKYALGAFNFVNLEMLHAIIEASKKTGKPCICAVLSTGAMSCVLPPKPFVTLPTPPSTAPQIPMLSLRSCTRAIRTAIFY